MAVCRYCGLNSREINELQDCAERIIEIAKASSKLLQEHNVRVKEQNKLVDGITRTNASSDA